MKFTTRRIEDLECPADKKDILKFDDEQRGLGVRVTELARKGSLLGKSYLAQYLLGGIKRRIPLGSCSAISLAAAREAVRAILGDVAKGRDPAAERKEAARQASSQALTLEALLEQWRALKLADRRERYAAEAVRALKHAFPKHLRAPADDLDRAAVIRVLDALARDGKSAMARATAAYGRSCYQWAAKRGSLAVNPFMGLSLAADVKRERVLTDDELRSIWRATAGPGPFNAIVRMLVLTGQRRGEVGMTWDELAPDLSAWTIPSVRTKNGVAHIAPLSPQARAILRVCPQFDDSALVFPGLRGPFAGFDKAKAALDRASGVEDWRLHDIRRTVATGLQRLGVRLEVTEAVLNHIAGSRAGIVGVYQKHTWADEKRAALNAWGEHVAVIVEGRTAAGNVTQLRRSS
ncbi:MAG TPA: site-specific integrase [Roseiarcus sp.]|jgi:integrase|nr:site-specific integrase [Roseiarcus sp.]